MSTIAETNSLFEIDAELDGLIEEIEGQVESEGQASEDLVSRFQQFCEAHGEKVDRIGRFLRIMEAREQYCRSEARVHLGTGWLTAEENRRFGVVHGSQNFWYSIQHRVR